MKSERFRIGSWQVDPNGLTLVDGRVRRQVQARTMALLEALYHADGELLSKDQLSENVWGEAGASDELIARHISMIRQALGDDARNPRYVETVPRLGYRLLRPTPGRFPGWAAVAAIGVVVIASAVLIINRESESGRLLAPPRPLIQPGPLRADLAASPADQALAWIEAERVDLAGMVVVRMDLTDTPRVVSEGLNRFPSFSPSGSRLAYVHDDPGSGCRLRVQPRQGGGLLIDHPCAGTVNSPPAWLDDHHLLLSVSDQSGGRLDAVDLTAGESQLAWQAAPEERFEFPRLLGGQLVGVLVAGASDRVVALDLDTGQISNRYGDEQTRIRWLDVQSDRVLLVLRDVDGRYVLYQLSGDLSKAQLIGNRDSVQSAAYRYDGDGVHYAATRVQQSLRAWVRGVDRRFHARALDHVDENTAQGVLSPAGNELAFVAANASGVGLYIIGSLDGLRRELVSAEGEQRIRFPAWSPDGAAVGFVQSSAEGHHLLIVGSAEGRILHRHALLFTPGPLQLLDGLQQALVWQVRGSRLSAYRVDLVSGSAQPWFEVQGQAAWLSEGDERIYLVDSAFRFAELPLSDPDGVPQPILPVGAGRGWTVAAGRVFYACPEQPSHEAMLCEFHLERRSLTPHPEVTFYPSQLSASSDGNVLLTPRVEQMRLNLVTAKWMSTTR